MKIVAPPTVTSIGVDWMIPYSLMMELGTYSFLVRENR